MSAKEKSAVPMIARFFVVVAVLSLAASCGGGKGRPDPKSFAREWKAHQAINFTIYTPPNTNRPKRSLEAIAKASDDTYDYAAKQLQISYDGDIGIYIFSTSEECEKTTGRPASYVDRLNIYTRVGAPYGGLIAEALCNSLDPEAPSFTLIRDGIRNLFDERDINIHYEAAGIRATTPWPSLEELLDKQSHSDPQLYKYASASFVAFLIQRYGSDQFHMLWRSVLPLRQSIEKIYGGTIPQMEDEWFRMQDRMAKRT